MSAPTVDGLRALCPECHKAVRVRRQGAAWRMVAHKHRTSSWGGSRDVACPVRDADAVPRIAAWIATAREALAALCADLRARLRAEAERLRTAADELDAPTVPA